MGIGLRECSIGCLLLCHLFSLSLRVDGGPLESRRPLDRVLVLGVSLSAGMVICPEPATLGTYKLVALRSDKPSTRLSHNHFFTCSRVPTDHIDYFYRVFFCHVSPSLLSRTHYGSLAPGVTVRYWLVSVKD